MDDRQIGVLIIEDEKSYAKPLTKTLEKNNFAVRFENNGRDGLVAALSDHPDIILLDLMMPDMDGMQVLRTLRKDDWGKNVLIIIMTNIELEEKNAESLDCVYLVKSKYSLKQIEELLNETRDIVEYYKKFLKEKYTVKTVVEKLRKRLEDK